MLVDQFGLERVEEALGDGVVETAARSAGAEDEAGAPSELLDPQGEKRPAPIGVEEESRSRPPLGERHGEGLVGELLIEGGRHGPADEAAGVEVEHDGQMEPALAGPHRGDVGYPALIGRLSGEVAPQAIGRGRQLGPGGRGPAEAPLGASDDSLVPHEPGDAVPPRGDALSPELLMNAGRPLGPPARGVDRPNVDEQGAIALGLARGRASDPGVEATGRDAQDPTEAPHAKLGPIRGDEVELHFWSSAK
jgi:hypothetical protein